ncbi:MAG: hypothetical protein HYS13_04135 [Planctomycetia bacterium]|nr:hypothetical protein [Planctomycetia bacterium]
MASRPLIGEPFVRLERRALAALIEGPPGVFQIPASPLVIDHFRGLVDVEFRTAGGTYRALRKPAVFDLGAVLTIVPKSLVSKLNIYAGGVGSIPHYVELSSALVKSKVASLSPAQAPRTSSSIRAELKQVFLSFPEWKNAALPTICALIDDPTEQVLLGTNLLVHLDPVPGTATRENVVDRGEPDPARQIRYRERMRGFFLRASDPAKLVKK